MKMKKTLLALAFTSAGLLAVPAVFAQSAPTHNDGWFINGNVGRTSINHGPYNDNDTGYGINGGYRWALNPAVALGAEVGYNDLGNIHAEEHLQQPAGRRPTASRSCTAGPPARTVTSTSARTGTSAHAPVSTAGRVTA